MESSDLAEGIYCLLGGSQPPVYSETAVKNSLYLGKDFERAHFSDTFSENFLDFSGTNFSGANLRETFFCLSVPLENAVFERADFYGSQIGPGDVSDVSFRGASFKKSLLGGVLFIGCDFSSADLRGRFEACQFSNCLFSNSVKEEDDFFSCHFN